MLEVPIGTFFSAFLLVMFVYKTKDLCEVNLHEFGKRGGIERGISFIFIIQVSSIKFKILQKKKNIFFSAVILYRI